MGINIPADAEIIQESRLTKLCAIKGIYKAEVESDRGLPAKIKQVMLDKGAKYAQSEFAVAVLRGGEPKKIIAAKRLYQLVKRGKMTLEQFLECTDVVKGRVEKILAPPQIEEITETIPGVGGLSLFTEFKPSVAFSYPLLGDFIGLRAIELARAPAAV